MIDKNSNARQVHPIDVNPVPSPSTMLDMSNSPLHVSSIASTLHNHSLHHIWLPPVLPILMGILTTHNQLAMKSDMSNSPLHASSIAHTLHNPSLHHIRPPPALPILMGILMIHNQPATKSDMSNSPPHASSIPSTPCNHSLHH